MFCFAYMFRGQMHIQGFSSPAMIWNIKSVWENAANLIHSQNRFLLDCSQIIYLYYVLMSQQIQWNFILTTKYFNSPHHTRVKKAPDRSLYFHYENQISMGLLANQISLGLLWELNKLIFILNVSFQLTIFPKSLRGANKLKTRP